MLAEAPVLTLTQTHAGVTYQVSGIYYPSVTPWNIFMRFDRLMYDKSGMILPDRKWTLE